MNDDESTTQRDRADHDPVALVLRLIVGGAAEGADAILSRLFPPGSPGASALESGSADGRERSPATLASQAMIGLLFEAYGVASRGASTAGRVVVTTGRFWSSVFDPVFRSRLFRPIRLPSEYLLERGTQELERWARIGRGEEERSRELTRQLMMIPVEEIVAYLRTNPELEQLVRAQAQSLLDELAEDPSLSTVIFKQGDRYVDHLHEHPETVQELIRGQSVGLAEEVANSVRRRTVSADDLLERIVRAALRRPPRADLPDPPPEVLQQARPHGNEKR